MSEQDTTEKTIKSNETLFAILEFLKVNDGATLGEIADEIDIAKSTAHYHLKTLLELGFVTKQGEEYHIGMRFLDYATYARQELSLFNAAKPTIDELAKRCNERVWCVIEEHGQCVFVYTAEGKQAVDTDGRVGKRFPLHHISAGKAILAHLPDDRVEEIIGDHGLSARTPQTITDREELMEELAAIRERGYAFNYEESVPGLHAIGAPVFDSKRTVLGGISIVGPANRLTPNRIEDEYAELLLGAVNEIQLNLEYSA